MPNIRSIRCFSQDMSVGGPFSGVEAQVDVLDDGIALASDTEHRYANLYPTNFNAYGQVRADCAVIVYL